VVSPTVKDGIVVQSHGGMLNLVLRLSPLHWWQHGVSKHPSPLVILIIQPMIALSPPGGIRVKDHRGSNLSVWSRPMGTVNGHHGHTQPTLDTKLLAGLQEEGTILLSKYDVHFVYPRKHSEPTVTVSK
jgi:hypothetical protein